MKLTKDERKAIFRGTLEVLRRPEKPDEDPKEPIIVSATRGGRQIADRETGATVEVPSQPRLWITLKGWKLKQGSTEWETGVVIHDKRESDRVLANGIGGLPREAGLKTRWGSRVIHRGGEVKVVPKRVPNRHEQQESWTPETERGYGGRNELERSVDGDLVPAAGVDDATLAEFSAAVAEENEKRQRGRHAEAEAGRQKRLAAREYQRGKSSGANAAKRRAERAERRVAA